jgi:hypothetical protein
VAEGAGLENRYTGNGIVGSNPTLSVSRGALRRAPPPAFPDPMLPYLQAPAAPDCFLTGLCATRPDQVGPGSGLMFLALGFVALGAWGLWTEWRARIRRGR